MRSAMLFLAVALVAGATQARAEMVTYTMTGTITSTQPFDGYEPKFAVGDHISWTLQYNMFTPPMSTYSGTSSSGFLSTPLITQIVDHTTGSSFAVPSFYVNPAVSDATAGAILRLSSSPPKGSPSFVEVNQNASDTFGSEGLYNTSLNLNVNGPLPTLNLASLQLNSLPINWSTSSFFYSYEVDLEPGGQVYFTASVDSISAPMYGAPEPGSLTLFLLGTVGLAAHGMRRRLRQVR